MQTTQCLRSTASGLPVPEASAVTPRGGGGGAEPLKSISYT